MIFLLKIHEQFDSVIFLVTQIKLNALTNKISINYASHKKIPATNNRTVCQH